METQFAGAPTDEIRAAKYLLTFTHHAPLWRDRQGLQGAADIVLMTAQGSPEVVEVTSSIEDRHVRDTLQSQRLAEDIAAVYSGESVWLMHLTTGWRPPTNTKRRSLLAGRIARELESLDAAGSDGGTLTSADWIWVRRGDPDSPNVEVVSWSANIPDGGDMPYLDQLSSHLATSPVVANKREKLLREAETLGASRRHLYLLLAASGEHGGLLPPTPSYLTWGTFTAPPEITDLWLDGGNNQIYHWQDETGWRFHRLWNPDAVSALFTTNE